MAFNRFITSARSLVTTHEETRAGFLKIALEKNRLGDPYVKTALAFKATVAHITTPEELLNIQKIRPFLLSASGLSEKSLTHLTEADQTMAIQELIDKFLKPAGNNFIDEATFRYLLIKGDTVGGSMRNRIGALGQEKLVRAIISTMQVQGIVCNCLKTNEQTWKTINAGDVEVESNVKALGWSNNSKNRILIFNSTIPTVKKNVDICLYDGILSEYDNGKIVKNNSKAIMFGELKGGIDPAGADEHWKTGNTALERIRNSFKQAGYPTIKTSFVGAAIENAMAEEIYLQLQDGILSNGANLTNTNQLVEYCNWIIEL